MANPDDDWRFSLEDVEPDDPADDGGNVAGAFLPEGQIEPGSIDPENALFVALGALAAGLVLVGFVLALT